MIYNDEFIWLHYPKCAGSKIEQLFKAYFADEPGLHQDVVDPGKDPYASWHDGIPERMQRDPSFNPGSRMVICPFRRLPSWLESRYNFEYQRNPGLPHNPKDLLEGRFLEANGSASHADYYIFKYLPQALLDSGNVRFLRTEFFEADFKALFGRFLDVSRIPDEKFAKKVNVSQSRLPRGIKRKLFSDDRRVYTHCPHWHAVEKQAYPDA